MGSYRIHENTRTCARVVIGFMKIPERVKFVSYYLVMPQIARPSLHCGQQSIFSNGNVETSEIQASNQGALHLY